MTTQETLDNIPKKYLKPNISLSAEIVGINRSSFHMEYVKEGKVTRSEDERGKPYINIQELIRVFGFNTVIEGIKNLETPEIEAKNTEDTLNSVKNSANKHNPTQTKTQETALKTLTYDEFLDLKLKLQASEKDLERDRERIKMLEASLSEEKQRTREAESRAEKYYGDLTGSMRLLEDKTKTIDNLLADQAFQKQPWWKKILGKPSNKNAPVAPQSTEDAVKSSKG